MSRITPYVRPVTYFSPAELPLADEPASPSREPVAPKPTPPTQGPVPPKPRELVFVGMGDESRLEFDQMQRTLRDRALVFVGQSHGFDAHVSINGATFDMADDKDVDTFLQTAFTPPLSDAQKALLKDALQKSESGGRDELALVALELSRAQQSGKVVTDLVFSGHSNGSDVWGENNRNLSIASLAKLASAFPDAAKQVQSCIFIACNHLHEINVVELEKIFPNLQHAGGYSAQAPATQLGGSVHAREWARALSSGGDFSPSVMVSNLSHDRQSAKPTDPDIWAMDDAFHVAAWNKSDDQYRFFNEEPAGHFTLTTVRPNPNALVISARAQAVNLLENGVNDLMFGAHGELSTIDPNGDNIATRYYAAAQAFAGTVGLSAAQKQMADEDVQLGLCVRFYPRIVEKFGAINATLIAEAAKEGGAAVKTPAQMRSLTRWQMLQYITGLQGVQTPKTKELYDKLSHQIQWLGDIPQDWL